MTPNHKYFLFNDLVLRAYTDINLLDTTLLDTTCCGLSVMHSETMVLVAVAVATGHSWLW
jgi:hypothetical protein